MKDNQISFSVKMTAKEVFRFSIRHSYSRLSGFIGLLLSMLAIIMLITSFDQLGDQNKAVLFVVALWFTVLEPLMLLSRAKGQAKRNPAYKKPLEYVVNMEGITVSQGDQSQSIEWDCLRKIVETKHQYIVYSSKIHAFIFPKEAVGDQCDALKEMMKECTKDTKVALSIKMKK